MNDDPVIPRVGPVSLELSGGGGLLIRDPVNNARGALSVRQRRATKQLSA
jgi:hypothetical protein